MENWLTKRARLTPNRIAVTYGRDNMTFAAVAREARNVANQIAALHDDNSRVAVITNNTLSGYLVIMALQQLGKTIVFINRRLSIDEINYQLQDAKITLLLTDDTYAQDLQVKQQLSFSELPEPMQEITPIEAYEDDFVTTVMYTSGTTNHPKGVMQTYGNHFYSAVGSALNLGLTAEDSWLTVVPIFHISGFSILMRSLIYGMRVVLVDKFDADMINRYLINDPITTMSAVPVMLKQLLADLPDKSHYNDKFRVMLLGGGPTDRETLALAQNHGIPIVQSYGMTETASQVVALDPADSQRKIGSVGKPLFPVSVTIRDKSGKPANKGNIWIKSPTLTAGYLNQADKLAQHLQEEWFDTEDFGYLDDEGFLYIQGREGDMISSGGENIFPDEVEAVYSQMTGIDRIVVVGVPDNKWGAVPVAVVSGKMISKISLLSFGREKLAHYKVPKRFYDAKEWYVTASGKVQRHKFVEALPDLDEIK